MRLKREFYTKSSYNLAQLLIGKVLCLKKKGIFEQYRIVETEAYGGITDKAAHSYNALRTKRTEVMYLEGGHLYIYLIYGMYYMLNIVASTINNPEAVLIRAVEPIDPKSEKISTNGPGKLCKYLQIDKNYNGIDLVTSNIMYIYDDGYKVQDIIKTKRVNIDYAEEDASRLWRFYLKNSKYASKK